MNKTDIIPARELRNNYASVIEKLDNHDRVIITNRGHGQAVLMNYEDYQALEEFIHARYILDSLREAEKFAVSDDAEWLPHAEFWARS